MKGGVALEEMEKEGESPPMKKMKMTDYFTTERNDKENGENILGRMKETEIRPNEDKLSDDKYKIPKVTKMRMTDSLPKGCELKPKMRMTDSLPKGCEVKKPENEGVQAKTENGEEKKEGEEGIAEEELVEEEKKEYTMNIFNFRKANNWFKAIDLLKLDLTKDPRLKHFHPEGIFLLLRYFKRLNVPGWHPPKPSPPRKQYAPTKLIIGETPEGDQTW